MPKIVYDDPFGYKTCRKCKVLYPLSREYFYAKHACKDGLQSHCRKCNDTSRRIASKEKKYHKLNRRCKKCGSHFYALVWAVKNGEANYCSNKCCPKNTHGNGFGVKKGEKGHHSKLNENQVREIRELGSKEIHHREIAIMFNVSRRNIGYILNNKTWNHLKESSHANTR